MSRSVFIKELEWERNPSAGCFYKWQYHSLLQYLLLVSHTLFYCNVLYLRNPPSSLCHAPDSCLFCSCIVFQFLLYGLLTVFAVWLNCFSLFCNPSWVSLRKMGYVKLIIVTIHWPLFGCGCSLNVGKIERAPLWNGCSRRSSGKIQTFQVKGLSVTEGNCLQLVFPANTVALFEAPWMPIKWQKARAGPLLWGC